MEVTVIDPCVEAVYEFYKPNPKPEDLWVEITKGTFNTTEWAFTNDVNELYYEDFKDIYSWPICGYPTHYKLVDENEGPLPFECSKVEGILIDGEELDPITNKPI